MSQFVLKLILFYFTDLFIRVLQKIKIPDRVITRSEFPKYPQCPRERGVTQFPKVQLYSGAGNIFKLVNTTSMAKLSL